MDKDTVFFGAYYKLHWNSFKAIIGLAGLDTNAMCKSVLT